MSEWHAYVAGFWDGEGSVSIARLAGRGHADYHKIVVTLCQRKRHRQLLDRICAEFGGRVSERSAHLRRSSNSEVCVIWQLQKWADAGVYLQTIQPYVILKAPQIKIALTFLGTRISPGAVPRDGKGHACGRAMTPEIVGEREACRLALHAVNSLGPPERGNVERTPPSKLPALSMGTAWD